MFGNFSEPRRNQTHQKTKKSPLNPTHHNPTQPNPTRSSSQIMHNTASIRQGLLTPPHPQLQKILDQPPIRRSSLSVRPQAHHKLTLLTYLLIYFQYTLYI